MRGKEIDTEVESVLKPLDGSLSKPSMDEREIAIEEVSKDGESHQHPAAQTGLSRNLESD